MTTVPGEQLRVRDWFDAVYRDRGLGYLRPPEAYPVFLQLLEAQPGERLLDVACGPGLLLRAAQAHSLQATGVDLSGAAVAMVAQVAPGARALQSNAGHLPFEQASFDCVTCIGSLERFLDRRAALREMARVAAPKARFCLMVRNAQTFGWKVATQWLGRVNRSGHQDALALEDWNALFEECGFAVRRIVPDQWFYQRWRNRLLGPSGDRAEHIVTGIVPLRFANEFIYVLERKA